MASAEADTMTRPRTPPAGDAVRCAWCGAAIPSGARRRRGTVHCRVCGSDTTWPTPTDEELERAYGEWYRPDRGRFSGPGDRLLRALRGRLAHRIDAIAPPGPVLDVGAGDGALLDALAARGRTAVGLERDSDRSDVRAAELVETEGEWAAVVMWHSLEHLRDAGEAVAHAAGHLEPRGVIVIAMPNPASLQARLFGDRWLALDLPRHLVHVPAPALVSRLEDAGLRVERVSFSRGGQVLFGWLHGLVGLLPGHPDLYDAIRRSEARRSPISPHRRALVLGAALLALPAAAVGAAAEVVLRRGGTTYVEARRV